MKKQGTYKLEFLFDGKQITYTDLQYRISEISSPFHDLVTEIEKVSPDFLKVTIEGGLESIDRCHAEISEHVCSAINNIRILDEAGDEVRQTAYPILANIEQQLRAFVNRAMTEIIGFNWWEQITNQDIRNEINKLDIRVVPY